MKHLKINVENFIRYIIVYDYLKYFVSFSERSARFPFFVSKVKIDKQKKKVNKRTFIVLRLLNERYSSVSLKFIHIEGDWGCK